MSPQVKFIIQFILIITIQIVLLNEIEFKASYLFAGVPMFSPMIYPMLILLLPIQTPHWLQMVLGFIVGICIDFACSTPGMHAAATVFLAYIRPTIVRLFFQQPIKELSGVSPALFRMGFQSFLVYCIIAIVLHHLFYYIIQVFSFRKIHIILLKTILSSIMTIVLIILSQLLFTSRNVRRA